jgi:tRNA synthetases class II (A)
VSVYEEDAEAERIWLEKVGVPRERVKRMGADDNFWASGPTGPCGPCSELYYDFHPERGLEGANLDDDLRFIEFYNLVFMESNRAADGTLTSLVRFLVIVATPQHFFSLRALVCPAPENASPCHTSPSYLPDPAWTNDRGLVQIMKSEGDFQIWHSHPLAPLPPCEAPFLRTPLLPSLFTPPPLLAHTHTHKRMLWGNGTLRRLRPWVEAPAVQRMQAAVQAM